VKEEQNMARKLTPEQRLANQLQRQQEIAMCRALHAKTQEARRKQTKGEQNQSEGGTQHG
jgi:hypothetical protein